MVEYYILIRCSAQQNELEATIRPAAAEREGEKGWDVEGMEGGQ